jgi:hypothetical protein
VLASAAVWTSCHTTDVGNDDDHHHHHDHHEDGDEASTDGNCALYKKKVAVIDVFFLTYIKNNNQTPQASQQYNDRLLRKHIQTKNIDLLLAIVVCVLLMNQIQSSIL